MTKLRIKYDKNKKTPTKLIAGVKFLLKNDENTRSLRESLETLLVLLFSTNFWSVILSDDWLDQSLLKSSTNLLILAALQRCLANSSLRD